MNNIDDIFKDALESHVEPYDPQAWESLSKRLDKGIPPRSNPYLKWGLPSAVIVLGIAVGSWFISNSEGKRLPAGVSKGTVDQKPNPTKPAESNKNNNSNTQIVQANNQDQKASVNILKTTGVEAIPMFDCLSSSSQLLTNDAVLLQNNVVQEPIALEANTPIPTNQNYPSLDRIEPINPQQISAYQPLSTPSCEGSAFVFENTNDFSLTLKGTHEQNTSDVTLPSKSKTSVQIIPGNYELVNPKTGFALQQFHVGQGPTVEIFSEELNYTSGLPVKLFKIKSESALKEVQLNHKPIGFTGKELSLTFFNEGNQNLSAQVVDDKGCVYRKEESFFIQDKYNLLAVNAFEPLSQDARKNTFLPYALTIRNTPFRMIIIDPNDGGVVFETRDASMPWDGIDRRCGRMIDANKAFAWKVYLSQPEPGEKAEYMGTIVRL